MREIPSPLILTPPPPLPHSPPPPPPKGNLSMLYYGLVVVGTAFIVLAIYNLIIIKWCANSESQSRQEPNRFIEVATSQNIDYPHRNMLTSFKYKKDNNSNMVAQDQGSEYECAVCLSYFEEGEDVRQLPRCKHSFHAPCIDMWLYSHYDCPLCRAHVDVPRCHRHRVSISENSREGLLDSGISV